MINKAFIAAYIRDADSIGRGEKMYIAFILLWTLFESWIKDLTQETNVTEAIKKHFTHQSSFFKQVWKKLAFQNLIGPLMIIKDNCPVGDKRKSPATNPVDITDVKNPDLQELTMVLYRLRSNLIHGAEDITNDSNIKLYTACRDVLAPWLKQAS